MSDWRAAARTGDALVTVLATEGSAPRGAGARMVVAADRVAGTIGGGALELRATEQARALLAHPPGSWRVQDYPLGPLLGQCCGGRVRLLIERLGEVEWVGGLGDGVVATLREGAINRRTRRPGGGRNRMGEAPGHAPGNPGLRRDDGVRARGPLPTAGFTFLETEDSPRRQVLMFGAGHVGSAIAAAAPGLPLDLAWYDSRPELDRAGLVIAAEAALIACAGEARAGSAVLILTHDHALDYRLAAAALSSEAAFVGLIGSATKRARFVARLTADGIDPARLTCPIGQPGIVGKQPTVIAIAVLAQLLALAPPTC